MNRHSALEIQLSSRQLPSVLPRQTDFIVITSAKRFLAKYIFSLQLLILIFRQNYRLQTRDIICTCQKCVCMCYKKSDQLLCYPHSLLSRGNGSSFAFTSYIIVSAKSCSVTCLNNFYFVSFLYHLFICRRQRKIKLVTFSKSYLYKFFF